MVELSDLEVFSLLCAVFSLLPTVDLAGMFDFMALLDFVSADLEVVLTEGGTRPLLTAGLTRPDWPVEPGGFRELAILEG